MGLEVAPYDGDRVWVGVGEVEDVVCYCFISEEGVFVGSCWEVGADEEEGCVTRGVDQDGGDSGGGTSGFAGEFSYVVRPRGVRSEGDQTPDGVLGSASG